MPLVTSQREQIGMAMTLTHAHTHPYIHMCMSMYVIAMSIGSLCDVTRGTDSSIDLCHHFAVYLCLCPTHLVQDATTAGNQRCFEMGCCKHKAKDSAFWRSNQSHEASTGRAQDEEWKKNKQKRLHSEADLPEPD